MRLNRKIEARCKLSYGRATIESTLRSIYIACLKEEEYRRSRFEANGENPWRFTYREHPLEGVGKVYQKIGKGLIDFRIKEDVEVFAELLDNFCEVGYDVGFLTHEFQDRGLIEEEGGWLGIKKRVVGNAGKILFEPSDYLAGKPPIQDCSPEELVNLYVYYLQGKSDFYSRQFDDGTFWKKPFTERRKLIDLIGS